MLALGLIAVTGVVIDKMVGFRHQQKRKIETLIKTLSDDFINIFCKTEKEEKESRRLAPRGKSFNGTSFSLNLISDLHAKCKRKVGAKVRVEKGKLARLCAFGGYCFGDKFREFCENDGNNEIELECIEKNERYGKDGLKLNFCYFPKEERGGVLHSSAMIKNDMNSLFTLYNFFFVEEPIVVNKSGTKVKIERKEGFFTVTRYDGDSKTLVFTFDPKKIMGTLMFFGKRLL